MRAPELGPNAKISVMGGEQAANVLLTIKLDQLAVAGQAMSLEEQEAFKAPTWAKYAEEASAYYATARLWDDGIIDPVDTARVLALGIEAARNAPIPPPVFSSFPPSNWKSSWSATISIGWPLDPDLPGCGSCFMRAFFTMWNFEASFFPSNSTMKVSAEPCVTLFP